MSSVSAELCFLCLMVASFSKYHCGSSRLFCTFSRTRIPLLYNQGCKETLMLWILHTSVFAGYKSFNLQFFSKPPFTFT